MSRVSIYSFHVPKGASFPRALSFEEAHHEAVPEDVYQRHASGSDAVHGWALPDALESFVVSPEPGDVVLFHRDDVCRMVATIAAIVDAPDLADRFAGDDAEALVFLSNVESIDRPLEDVLERLSPSPSPPAANPPGLLVHIDTERSVDWGLYSYLGPLLDGLERKRLYDLVLARGATDLLAFLVPGPDSPPVQFARAVDEELGAVFRRPGGPRALKLVGAPLLIGAALLAGGAEVLWCALAALDLRAPLLPRGCPHVVTPGLVGPATAFAVALTAVLLVGAAVVVAGVARPADRADEDLRLVVRSGATEGDRAGDARLDDLDVRKVGDFRVVEDGVVRWVAAAFADDRLVVRETDADPAGIGPAEGRYRLRVVREGIPPETALGERGWRVTGRAEVEAPAGTRSERLFGDDGRVDWWIAPVEAAVDGLRARLAAALAYALSASILGVLILWYPWQPAPAGAAWLADLTAAEHAAYTLLSYLFVGTLVGTYYTALDLAELLTETGDEAG